MSLVRYYVTADAECELPTPATLELMDMIQEDLNLTISMHPTLTRAMYPTLTLKLPKRCLILTVSLALSVYTTLNLTTYLP